MKTGIWLWSTMAMAAATAVTLIPAAGQQAPAPQADTRPASMGASAPVSAAVQLQKLLPRVTFNDADLKDVFQSLRDQTGASIHVRWNALAAAGITKNTVVTLESNNVTLEQALRLVLDGVGASAALDFTEDGNLIIVSTGDDLTTHTVIRRYDVQDLVRQSRPRLEEILTPPSAPTTQGSNIASNIDYCQASNSDEEGGFPVEALINMIKSLCTPYSWNDPYHVQVAAYANTLVITQTASNHKKIEHLLTLLRQQREASRLTLGVAIVKVPDGKSAAALAAALAGAKDIPADLVAGAADGKWVVERCSVEDTFSGDRIRIARSGTGLSGYDVLICPQARSPDGVLTAGVSVTGTWMEKTVSMARTDTLRLQVKPAAMQTATLLPSDAPGGGAILVLWQPGSK
ncbi:MAG: STN domain-containing protein [Planctomycetaceae bacterium]|nr:STN domain-containing protein [Planctomycetaceae bacterium]